MHNHNSNSSHKKLNEAIVALKDDKTIEDILTLDPSLEILLGLTKGSNPDVDLYVNLENNEKKCLSSAGYKRITDFIKKVIEA